MTHSPLLILESSTLQLPDQICNSLYCQPYNSYNVSSENLVLDQLIIPKLIFFFILITYLFDIVLIAALAERSPIIIQYSSNPSRRKDLDVRPYDRSTVQSASFKMRGQLYRGHVNAMALFGSPVVSALGFEWDDPGSSPGCGKALETCGKKKCELRF